MIKTETKQPQKRLQRSQSYTELRADLAQNVKKPALK